MFHLTHFEQNKNFSQKIGSVSYVYGILIHGKIEKNVIPKSRRNGVNDGKADRTEFIGPSDRKIYHKKQKHEQNLKVWKVLPLLGFLLF